MNQNSQAYAVMAEFDTADAILSAAKKVHGRGFVKWDVFTPFPVRGMNRAMGLKSSPVGWFAFVGAAMGFILGMAMVWWMNARDYPIIVGGKPMFSPWAAFPVAFELAILLGSFGALWGLFFLTRLPRLHHPLLKNRRFALASHDRFFLVIETADPKYSATETQRFLESAGCRAIEWIEN